MTTDRKRSESSAKKNEKQFVKPKEVEVAVETTKTEAQIAGPLDEFLGRAQKAYLTYLEAQKDVWKAYHETEQKFEEDFREAEQKASNVRDETIEQCLISQAKAEQGAEQAYLRAIELAQQECARAREEANNVAKENIRRAIANYKQTVEQTRTVRDQAMQRAQKIFA